MTDKVVCITGAGRGIGRATAGAVARTGATVIVADVDAAGAADVAKGIEASGGTAVAVTCDVTKPEDVSAMMAVAAELGGLTCLVNNAGIFPRHDLSTMNADDLDRVLAVNVRGPLLCTLAAIPQLQAVKGHLIFVGTGSAHPESAKHHQGKFFPFYGTSKAALERLAASFACDLEPSGVTTSIFRPPGTRTEGSLATELTQQEFDEMADATDVGSALAWLVDRQSMPETGVTYEYTDFGTVWGDL
ncbi:MAG: fabG4 [Acidimicrobiales bacterium]|nr:fabG4 [Acidimicrobiales bacterium]